MADDVVIRAEGLGKKYVIGHDGRTRAPLTLRDVMARGARNAWRKTADMARGRAIVAGDTSRGILGAQGCKFRGQTRRGSGHHRSQWRRQEHVAEDSLAHHRADRGPRDD